MNDAELAREWCGLYARRLADGRVLAVVPLSYGRARIVIGEGMFVDDGW